MIKFFVQHVKGVPIHIFEHSDDLFCLVLWDTKDNFLTVVLP